MSLVSTLQNNHSTSDLKRIVQHEMILYFIYKKMFYALSKKKENITEGLEAKTDFLGKLVCKDETKECTEIRQDEV